jgi:hypothetical protein
MTTREKELLAAAAVVVLALLWLRHRQQTLVVAQAVKPAKAVAKPAVKATRTVTPPKPKPTVPAAAPRKAFVIPKVAAPTASTTMNLKPIVPLPKAMLARVAAEQKAGTLKVQNILAPNPQVTSWAAQTALRPSAITPFQRSAAAPQLSSRVGAAFL